MTEPPEPRYPEEGGGEDDFLGELDDDMLLDALGRGEDEAGELGDLLGNWRDEVGSEPVGPIAENAQEIHELNQQYDKPAERPTPRAPETGGQPGMGSVNENAAQVGTMSNDHTAQSAVSSCKQYLDDAMGAIAAASDHVTSSAGTAAELLGGEEGNTINGQGQAFGAAITELQGMIQAAAAKADDVAGFANAFNTALRDAAQRHGGN